MHHPKHSMCKVCTKRNDNCSKLDFTSMPVIGKYTENKVVYLVVKCTEWRKYDM